MKKVLFVSSLSLSFQFVPNVFHPPTTHFQEEAHPIVSTASL